MASVRGLLNIQSLNELTYENTTRGVLQHSINTSIAMAQPRARPSRIIRSGKGCECSGPVAVHMPPPPRTSTPAASGEQRTTTVRGDDRDGWIWRG
jgi:hypothetical protein